MNRNITLSAEESMIQQARRRAMAENMTLNDLFRVWLERYIAAPAAATQFRELMQRFDHIQAGHNFSREEMNERR
ncbi:MAG: hypothetical protein NT075_29375 [Chloroflexi bacterium]|nr:hypothetical protein [Chloroflexota bacterium]